MRFAAALSFFAVLSIVGCAPGADGELRALVEDVAPAKRELVECEWGSNWGAGAKKYYGCSWLVPGKVGRASRGVISGLAAHGFTVLCDGGGKNVELLAVQGKTRIYVNVLARSLVRDIDIPPGTVLVEIAADDQGASQPLNGRVCASP